MQLRNYSSELPYIADSAFLWHITKGSGPLESFDTRNSGTFNIVTIVEVAERKLQPAFLILDLPTHKIFP